MSRDATRFRGRNADPRFRTPFSTDGAFELSRTTDVELQLNLDIPSIDSSECFETGGDLSLSLFLPISHSTIVQCDCAGDSELSDGEAILQSKTTTIVIRDHSGLNSLRSQSSLVSTQYHPGVVREERIIDENIDCEDESDSASSAASAAPV